MTVVFIINDKHETQLEFEILKKKFDGFKKPLSPWDININEQVLLKYSYSLPELSEGIKLIKVDGMIKNMKLDL